MAVQVFHAAFKLAWPIRISITRIRSRFPALPSAFSTHFSKASTSPRFATRCSSRRISFCSSTNATQVWKPALAPRLATCNEIKETVVTGRSLRLISGVTQSAAIAFVPGSNGTHLASHGEHALPLVHHRLPRRPRSRQITVGDARSKPAQLLHFFCSLQPLYRRRCSAHTASEITERRLRTQ